MQPLTKIGLSLAATVALAVPAVAWLAGDSDPAPAPQPSSQPESAPSSQLSTPPSPAARTLLIGVIGDFGKRGGRAPVMVGVLRDYARTHGLGGRLAALVTTGDNAYEHGTPAEARYARSLLDPLLGAGTSLVASLGNHDVATAGGAATKREFGIPANYYTTVVGPVQFVVLDANAPTDRTQIAWLRRTLAAGRTTPFRVAVFHQPAAACSAHAADYDVIRNWLPLLDAGVDLVLSGHNHAYERFLDSAGLPLVTTGGGGAAIYPSLRGLCTGTAVPQVLRTTNNVVVLSFTGGPGAGRLHLRALNGRGEEFDRVEITRRYGRP